MSVTLSKTFTDANGNKIVKSVVPIRGEHDQIIGINYVDEIKIEESVHLHNHEVTSGFIQKVGEMENEPEGVTLSTTSDVELIAHAQNLEEEIKKVVGNEKVKEHCLANATDIKSKCKGWFTVEQLARKIMMLDKQEQVIDLLNLLCLFQMAYRKEHKGELRYKIQLSKEDKISVLVEELYHAEQKVASIKSKIEEITNK